MRSGWRGGLNAHGFQLKGYFTPRCEASFELKARAFNPPRPGSNSDLPSAKRPRYQLHHTYMCTIERALMVNKVDVGRVS